MVKVFKCLHFAASSKRQVFERSGLPPADLAEVWRQSADGDGCLNREESKSSYTFLSLSIINYVLIFLLLSLLFLTIVRQVSPPQLCVGFLSLALHPPSFRRLTSHTHASPLTPLCLVALLLGFAIKARTSRLLEMALLFPSYHVTSCHVTSCRVVPRRVALRFAVDVTWIAAHSAAHTYTSHTHSAHRATIATHTTRLKDFLRAMVMLQRRREVRRERL